MNDQITRTTQTSWFSRIGKALTGVLVGLVLILVCVALLFWNEGRAVKTEIGLKQGASSVVSVDASPIVPGNDQKLVHVSGPLSVSVPISDPVFGITASGVRLSRKVEMYQWRETTSTETRTKLGGGEETVTTYRYAKAWSAEAENSDGFAEPNGHRNPSFDVEAAEFLASNVSLGDFSLDGAIVARIDGAMPMPLDAGILPQVREAAGTLRRSISISQNQILLSDQPRVATASGTQVQTLVTEPSIGDLRVEYTLVPAAMTSVVAGQRGGSLATYQAENGEPILLIAEGQVAASSMFEGAQDANRVITWVLRGAGVIVLMIGFGMILAPLGVLADVLPVAGTLVRAGTGLVGFVLGLVVGTITIALAWLAFRPLVAFGILVTGCAIAYGVYRLGAARGRRLRPVETVMPAP